MLKHMTMISTRTSEEAAQDESNQQDQSQETASAIAATSRMDPYFKQPDLPADFKFMEPYIKSNERQWK